MKNVFKIVMAAAVALISINANAQFGVKFGYTSQTSKFSYDGSSYSPKAQSGFFAGFTYDIPTAANGLSVRPGLIYQYVGGKSILADELSYELEVSSNKVKDQSHSVLVPVDLKYAYSVNDEFSIYAFAGPRAEVGIIYLATFKESGAKGSIDLYTGKIKVKYDGETMSEEMEDGGLASRFDLKLGFGAGFQYRRVSFEIGYDIGMLNRIKSTYVEDDETLKRSGLNIGIGFAF